jgi:hypothetical protein
MSKITITPLPTPPPAPPPPAIKLSIDLTQREADALAALCCRIGGCPDNSPRKLFSEILSVLDRHGVKRIEDLINVGDSIYFKPWKN